MARDGIKGEHWFPFVLSKLYPIRWMEFTLQPDDSQLLAPRFCWDFYGADSEVYERIQHAIESFQGKVHWYLFQGYGHTCIGASPNRLLFMAPVRIEDKEPAHVRDQQPLAPNPEFVAVAIEDIPLLCKHLEEELRILDAQPKHFKPGIESSTVATPTLENRKQDSDEPGMHTTWLVKDTSAFSVEPRPTSELDRVLNFGLTYDEWRALYLDVLGANQPKNEALRGNYAESLIVELADPIPNYPMLSRIPVYLYDAAFEPHEVQQLRQECLRIHSSTSNLIALRSLKKLLRACGEPQKLRLGIYLLTD